MLFQNSVKRNPHITTQNEGEAFFNLMTGLWFSGHVHFQGPLFLTATQKQNERAKDEIGQ
jgi:hypothetical protein